METIQIISGYSDLKVALADNCRIIKPLKELELWFSRMEDVLYLHDRGDHAISMALAILRDAREIGKIFLKESRPGHRLILDSPRRWKEYSREPTMESFLNGEFKSYGWFFSGRKLR